jgi:hypothetical protein
LSTEVFMGVREIINYLENKTVWAVFLKHVVVTVLFHVLEMNEHVICSLSCRFSLQIILFNYYESFLHPSKVVHRSKWMTFFKVFFLCCVVRSFIETFL